MCERGHFSFVVLSSLFSLHCALCSVLCSLFRFLFCNKFLLPLPVILLLFLLCENRCCCCCIYPLRHRRTFAHLTAAKSCDFFSGLFHSVPSLAPPLSRPSSSTLSPSHGFGWVFSILSYANFGHLTWPTMHFVNSDEFRWVESQFTMGIACLRVAIVTVLKLRESSRLALPQC